MRPRAAVLLAAAGVLAYGLGDVTDSTALRGLSLVPWIAAAVLIAWRA